MESGARTAPFIGSQYCLLHNPGPGWAPGHWSDLESWYSELYRASLFKERERWSDPDTVLVFRHHPRVWRKLLSASAPSHHTHVRRASLTFLNNNHKVRVKFSTLIILLIWKTPMLRRQMAMSDEQTAVWVALKEQTGGKHMLTTQHQRWAKISTINISSLLWSGWFQNLVYTHCQWSLELVDLYIMFMVPRFSHFRYLHWFCSNFLHKVHNAAKHLGMNGK